MNLRLLLLKKIRSGIQVLKRSKQSQPRYDVCYLEELHCSKGEGAHQPEAREQAHPSFQCVKGFLSHTSTPSDSPLKNCTVVTRGGGASLHSGGAGREAWERTDPAPTPGDTQQGKGRWTL